MQPGPTVIMDTLTAVGLVNARGQIVAKADIRITYSRGYMHEGRKVEAGEIIRDLDMFHAAEAVLGPNPKAEFVKNGEAAKRGPGRPRKADVQPDDD